MTADELKAKLHTAFGDYGIDASYEELVGLMCDEVLLQVDDDGYHGDSRLLIRKGSQIGLLIFGWGSCSGCDALQSCVNYEDLAWLFAELEQSIRWDDAAGMLAFFRAHDWAGDYSHDPSFVAHGIELLAERCA